MKLLLDANLSPLVRDGLREHGHEAVHVGDVGLMHAKDEAILAFAAEEESVLVTADHDFGAMLALSGATQPSVVHLRGIGELRPADHLRLLVGNLAQVSEDLAAGAIVSLSPTRLAVHRLPIV